MSPRYDTQDDSETLIDLFRDTRYILNIAELVIYGHCLLISGLLAGSAILTIIGNYARVPTRLCYFGKHTMPTAHLAIGL